MSYEEPIEYVPAKKSQSVAWKLCRNVAVLWVAAMTVVCFTLIDGFDPSFWAVSSAPAIVPLGLGLAFRR